jgi:hypothetical protein
LLSVEQVDFNNIGSVKQFADRLIGHAALAAFRDHFAPRAIKGGMHFNYANLSEAFKVYVNEFDNLKATSADNFNKCDLFWRQVIGFIQRGMPACDRQAFAQGIYITEGKKKLRRTFDFRYRGDHACTGLGFKWASWCDGFVARSAADVGIFMSNKNFKLAKLMQPTEVPRASWCVIC